MKKLFFAAAFLAVTVGANAQDYILKYPATQAEATELGWEGAWGNLEWGAVTPENFVIAENENIKITVEKPAYVMYSCSKAGKDVFPNYIYFGSQLGRESADPIYSLDAVYRDGNAIFTVEPVVNGRLTLYYNRGTNNSTAYVWDMTANGEVGVCALTNMTPIADGSAEKIHTPSVALVAGHKYYVASSDNGVEMYQMTFDAYDGESYVDALPAEADYLLDYPATQAEATELGWEGAWGNLEWGAVTPENFVIAENENIKVTVEKPAYVMYSCSKAGKDIFPNYIYIGSQIGRESADPIYSLDAVYRDGNAIFTVEPVVNGKLNLYYNRGTNNSTLYVWDMTANGEVGVCALANMTPIADGSEEKIHTPNVALVAGHKYYVTSSDNGVEMYQMTFAPYDSENYSGTTGIQNIVTSTVATPADGKVYTIDGRYVGKDKGALSKGLYIQNGKKFVVK